MKNKFNVLVIDPPWSFSDKLSMSKVKRGAEANYKTLSNEDIKNLDVGKLAAKDSLLVLWVPSCLLQEGLDIMKAYGFQFKQTWIWVKTKKKPLKNLDDIVKKNSKLYGGVRTISDISDIISDFSIQEILGFGMGHYFRQTHEIALVGVRGKILKKIKYKSCRSVFLAPLGKHSQKPEGLQDMLDLMFPGKHNKKIEIFARRERKGYVTIGNECPSTMGQDIRDSIKYLNENSPSK